LKRNAKQKKVLKMFEVERKKNEAAIERLGNMISLVIVNLISSNADLDLGKVIGTNT